MSTPRQFIPVASSQSPYFVGVDLGGTGIKAGVVDDLGRALSWDKIPTETETGPEDAARRMGELVLKVVQQARLKPADIGRVGLGSPGTMDVPAGMLLEPPNLPGWENFPIRDRVSHHCGLPVTFANDANAAAYGEFWVGRGREYRSMVLLTLGTGVGGGIIVGDELIEGQHSHGAECGHIIIDCRDDARVCSCGQPGHLEAYCSAVAVIKRAQEALDGGRKSSVTARLERGEELTPLLMAKEAEAGDQFSLEIIMETARYLGIGIVSLMHTIDPEGVVLGGAMTFGRTENDLGRRFLARVSEEIHSRAFPVPARHTKLEYASLGADAGFIGAAGVARLAHRRNKVKDT